MKVLAAIAFLAVLAATAAWPGDREEEAKGILQMRCTGTCHQTPLAAHLSERQWRVVLNTMQKRMEAAGMVPMTEHEFDVLLDYLVSQSGH